MLIDGMTQQQVADELGRAAIFLFGAEREGVGLPGAEAMASGCFVVGFTGDGAKEYMLPDHSSVIADSDVVDMCDRTLEAMYWFDHGPRPVRPTDRPRPHVGPRTARSRTGARATARQSSPAITAPGSPSLMPAAVTLPHYQAHASSTDLLGRGHASA